MEGKVASRRNFVFKRSTYNETPRSNCSWGFVFVWGFSVHVVRAIVAPARQISSVLVFLDLSSDLTISVCG